MVTYVSTPNGEATVRCEADGTIAVLQGTNLARAPFRSILNPRYAFAGRVMTNIAVLDAYVLEGHLYFTVLATDSKGIAVFKHVHPNVGSHSPIVANAAGHVMSTGYLTLFQEPDMLIDVSAVTYNAALERVYLEASAAGVRSVFYVDMAFVDFDDVPVVSAVVSAVPISDVLLAYGTDGVQRTVFASQEGDIVTLYDAAGALIQDFEGCASSRLGLSSGDASNSEFDTVVVYNDGSYYLLPLGKCVYGDVVSAWLSQLPGDGQLNLLTSAGDLDYLVSYELDVTPAHVYVYTETERHNILHLDGSPVVAAEAAPLRLPFSGVASHDGGHVTATFMEDAENPSYSAVSFTRYDADGVMVAEYPVPAFEDVTEPDVESKLVRIDDTYVFENTAIANGFTTGNNTGYPGLRRGNVELVWDEADQLLTARVTDPETLDVLTYDWHGGVSVADNAGYPVKSIFLDDHFGALVWSNSDPVTNPATFTLTLSTFVNHSVVGIGWNHKVLAEDVTVFPGSADLFEYNGDNYLVSAVDVLGGALDSVRIYRIDDYETATPTLVEVQQLSYGGNESVQSLRAEGKFVAFTTEEHPVGIVGESLVTEDYGLGNVESACSDTQWINAAANPEDGDVELEALYVRLEYGQWQIYAQMKTNGADALINVLGTGLAVTLVSTESHLVYLGRATGPALTYAAGSAAIDSASLLADLQNIPYDTAASPASNVGAVFFADLAANLDLCTVSAVSSARVVEPVQPAAAQLTMWNAETSTVSSAAFTEGVRAIAVINEVPSIAIASASVVN